VRLVLDANVLISAVRWHVKKRIVPGARTALLEVLASRTIVAFAPSFLEDEMRTQLAALAEKEGLTYAALAEAWAEYRELIIFYPARRPDEFPTDGNVADPKDRPYIETYLAVGATAIMTSDPHLARMGARTVDFEVSMSMRQYARDASIDFTLRWHGLVLEIATAAAVAGLFSGFVALVRAFARLPLAVRGLIVVAILAAIMHRPTRERIAAALRRGGESLAATINDVLPVIERLMRLASEKKQSAAEEWSKLSPLVPGRRVPLAAHVLAVCAAADRPLTSIEIRQRLAAVGASTTARTFPSYLRRVLRNHPDLVRSGDDLWRFRQSYNN
jgi:predicted nucleic acid-binding protein